MSVVVVDTGVANLHSVTSALSRLGAEWSVGTEIGDAERVILPGVGSAEAGMKALENKGLVESLRAFEKPMLGICLGMQMMYEGLGESGGQGLGLLEGDVAELNAGGRPLPHMGWNRLEIARKDALLEGVEDGAHVYFVHSFAAKGEGLAMTGYGERFVAVARSGNRMGCQFHPERSGAVGATILRNFLSL